MSDRLTCARCDGLADVRAQQSFLPDQAALGSCAKAAARRRRIVPRQYPGRKLPDKIVGLSESQGGTEVSDRGNRNERISSQLEIWTHQMSGDDWRLDALINRLPKRLRESVRALRRPS